MTPMDIYPIVMLSVFVAMIVVGATATCIADKRKKGAKKVRKAKRCTETLIEELKKDGWQKLDEFVETKKVISKIAKQYGVEIEQ